DVCSSDLSWLLNPTLQLQANCWSGVNNQGNTSSHKSGYFCAPLSCKQISLWQASGQSHCPSAVVTGAFTTDQDDVANGATGLPTHSVPRYAERSSILSSSIAE